MSVQSARWENWMADDIKLLPCPFCGCNLGMHDISGNSEGRVKYTFKCPDCPARMEFRSSTLEEAVNAWNRRAAVEADRQDHLADVRKMVPSDEELDDLSDEFHGY